MPLNKSEQTKNESILSDMLKDFSLSREKEDIVTSILLDFFKNQAITLMNLLEEEKEELLRIISAINTSIEQCRLNLERSIIDESLLSWGSRLRNAVEKRGALLELYSSQPPSGIAEILNSGENLPSDIWGTDLDIKHVLGKYLTDPKEINSSGTYILPAQDISTSIPYQRQLEELLETLKRKQVLRAVKVLTPLVNDNHWRVGIINFSSEHEVAAQLWDPLASSLDNKCVLAYQNMQESINKVISANIEVKFEAASIQKNGFQCMDFSVQKGLKELGEHEHPVVRAGNDSKKLRAAIVSTIISNQKVNALFNQKGKIMDFLEKSKQGDIEDELFLYFTKPPVGEIDQVRAVQNFFDYLLASELQELYHCSAQLLNEKKLVKEARQKALQAWMRYSFFACRDKQAERSEEDVLSLNSSPKC